MFILKWSSTSHRISKCSWFWSFEIWIFRAWKDGDTPPFAFLPAVSWCTTFLSCVSLMLFPSFLHVCVAFMFDRRFSLWNPYPIHVLRILLRWIYHSCASLFPQYCLPRYFDQWVSRMLAHTANYIDDFRFCRIFGQNLSTGAFHWLEISKLAQN